MTAQTEERRPAGELSGEENLNEDVATVTVRLDDLTQLGRRLFQEVVAEGEARTHERAAARFRWAMSRPGQDFGPGHPRFKGRRTVSEQHEHDAMLAAQAIACARHARLVRDRNGGASWLDG